MGVADSDDDDSDDLVAIRPPLRWAGSKRKQAVDLAGRCIVALKPGGRYFEPFLGSGAVALAMPPSMPMILADACVPLGYLWWWLQREAVAVAEYAAGYGLVKGEGWNTQDGYVAARLEHNTEPYSADDWRPSARFLWLMHAGFNGLYRENRQGFFNVPWGQRKRVSVPSPDELAAVAAHVTYADIRPGWDFEDVLAEARAGDVAYLDPPYDGNVTAFTSYVAKPFRPDDQARLCAAAEFAASRGVTVVATNADTPRIRDLYRSFAIETFDEPRRVAADPAARVPAPCLIMTLRGRV